VPPDPPSSSAPAEGGSVVGLWRYPVKSMIGEELNATEVTERGILRTAAQHHEANVGVYADVIAGGTIRRGDRVVPS